MSKVWRQRRRRSAPGDGQCLRAMTKSQFAHSGVVRLARNFDAHGTPWCVLDYTIQKLGNPLDHNLVNWCRCDAEICPHAAAKQDYCWCAATMPTGLSPYRWTMASASAHAARAPLRYFLGGTPYAARNFRPKWACRGSPAAITGRFASVCGISDSPSPHSQRRER